MPCMPGLHLTADLAGCDAARPAMTEPEALGALCRQLVQASGLTAVGELFHRFPAPGGVTGVVLLAESHLAVHTWPERAAATLDVFVCNASADHSAAAERLLSQLAEALGAHGIRRQRLRRDLPHHRP